MKEIVIFDVDNTIVNGQSQRLFLNYLYKNGYISFLRYFRILLWFVLYKIGTVSNPRPIMEYAFHFIKNKRVDYIESIVNDFFDKKLKNNIYPGVKNIIKEHQNSGKEVILLSNAADLLINKIANHLNIHDYLATKLEIVDGIYTGNIVGDIMYGESKVEAIKKYLQVRNLSIDDSWAYADHDSDITLLSNVKHPYAVNPSRKLKRFATLKNWPIIKFKI